MLVATFDRAETAALDQLGEGGGGVGGGDIELPAAEPSALPDLRNSPSLLRIDDEHPLEQLLDLW